MVVQVPVSGKATKHDARTSQPSRKGKKAWRRNIDNSEADAALEERANEQRLGGKTLAETTNESLFVIDAKGDENQRQKMKVFRLRIDEILTPESKLAPVKPRGPKATAGTKKQLSKEERLKVEKTAARIERKKAGPEPKRRKTEIEDPWADPEPDPTEGNEYLDPVRTVPIKRPRTIDRKAPSASIPAVVPSHPGTSYNPVFDDHQKLIVEAAEIEVTKEKAREKIQNSLAYPEELNYLDEDAEIGIAGDEDEEEEGEAGNDAEQQPKLLKDGSSAVTEKRLTKAEKNKRKRQLELEQQHEEARLRKRQARDLSSLPKMLKEIKKKEKNVPLRPPPGAESDPKRLGPYKFKEPSMDLNLTEELSESLRSIKPEGNLFKDRFVGLQRRNLIEPRVRVVRSRKYKQKFYEKPSYRFLA